MSQFEDQQLLHRRQKVLGSSTPLFYDRPLQLLRGEGAWVFDADGRRYLDAYNNVPHVGHCHPHVVDAMCRQAREININTRYLHPLIVELGERLTATFDDPLDVVAFTCTGTEANELAIRIARTHTGNQGLIVSDWNYHGHSITLAGATTALPAPEAMARHARTFAVPDMSRGVSAQASLAQLEQAIASLKESGHGVAAMLVDTIFSSEGLPDVPAGWLNSAMEMVHKAGGLLIADEVQPGFGRTGEGMWGYRVHGLIPDIVTMGKPMGNGHPIAATVTTRALLESFGQQSLYFNTFGGNPVSAAVGLAVLDVIEQEGLIAHARVAGAYAIRRLNAIIGRHPVIKQMRGRGLFFGLEMVDPVTGEPASAEARRVVNRMRDEGVLLSRIGHDDNILKIRPPMAFGCEHADFLIERLDKVLGEAR
ncbi:aminotransferase class III-fold pyridoxal phosphate-dependent enzyme [Sphingobium nicotianae]|uniref:Aminotransferase class III-fold pyridoxal phosphate-dependent enzyme n=1 Tax=Sphingobium nicotianae TaxID=2782607 RepID=A0A9X1DG64_9SPHN|nr:aminotransferase class III-fold pyridoxal phosphate-dependent enzyme [Sphingobium nicotianae]